MGEQTQFKPGDSAPNNGMYIEVGEFQHTSVMEPQVIHLKKGEPFPQTSNDERKWTHKKN